MRRAPPASGLLLLVACAAGFTAILDTGIVTLALPQIGLAFGTTASELGWTVNAYVLPFAISILAVGRLGDAYGHRRVIAAGALLFALGSLVCALSPSYAVLLAGRALQGLGASGLLTISLAVVASAYPAATRSRALGIYFASGATAGTVGPLLGGVLTSLLGWQGMFATQIPLALAVAMAALAVLPSSAGGRRSLDLPGLGLATLFLLGMNVALLQANDWGWASLPVATAWALAIAGLVGFVLRERSAAEPAVRLAVFRSRRFVASSIVGASAWFGIISGSVQLAIYLQAGRALDPTAAAIVLTPWPLAALVVFPLSGQIVTRFGGQAVMLVSLAVAAASAGAMIGFDAATPLPVVSLIAAVGGAAIALSVTASTVCAIAEFPPAEAGVASGIFNSLRQIGSSLGVAVPAAAFDLAAGGALIGTAALAGSSWALASRFGVIVVALAAVVVLLWRRAEPVEVRADREVLPDPVPIPERP